MAEFSHPNQSSSGKDWVDIAEQDSNLVDANITIFNNSSINGVWVYAGGSSAPSNEEAGVRLFPRTGVAFNSGNIWVRGEFGFSVALIEKT